MCFDEQEVLYVKDLQRKIGKIFMDIHDEEDARVELYQDDGEFYILPWSRTKDVLADNDTVYVNVDIKESDSESEDLRVKGVKENKWKEISKDIKSWMNQSRLLN